ncbi:hypothetical protein C1H46_031691 [Malus baccata]|uniref:Uncharacterized protein n=1 Tax=Malus baccata TaxID=106549 RepID=A0A540L8K6_MALBA|nr:hypothetical protein C1H46_031691 [Malus baccata]
MAMTFRLVASSCSKQRRNFIVTVALAFTAAISQPFNRTDHNQFQRRWMSYSSSSAANTTAKGGNFSFSDSNELDDMKYKP